MVKKNSNATWVTPENEPPKNPHQQSHCIFSSHWETREQRQGRQLRPDLTHFQPLTTTKTHKKTTPDHSTKSRPDQRCTFQHLLIDFICNVVVKQSEGLSMPLEPTAEFKRRRVKFLSGLVCTYINMDFEPIPAARTHRNDLEPS